MGDDAIGHAFVADQVGEFAGIDTRESNDAAGFQPFVKMFGVPVIRRFSDGGFDHEAAHGGAGCKIGGFTVVIIGADIADVREGECDDLARIGRVCEHFLVARHGGVETYLRHRLTFSAKTKALNHRAIGQNQNCCYFRLVPIAER
jgi:hypothetical protein